MTTEFGGRDRGDDADREDDAVALFSLLSDETRVRIVRELYRRHDRCPDDPALSFSTLGHRVGADDTGRFNYHLRRLRGSLVDKRESGYALSPAGVALGRLLFDDAGLELVALE